MGSTKTCAAHFGFIYNRNTNRNLCSINTVFRTHASKATIVSFGSFSFSQFKRYAIALFAKRFVIVVSQSASRIISAVPFSKSNEISPHSPSQSA